MGYTVFTKQLVQKYIDAHNPKSVIDLGAQNDYSYPFLPAPYISEWYKEKGIEYESIDLSNENDCMVEDLSTDLKFPWVDEDGENILYDFVLDIGTSEHIGYNGKFGWQAIYNCWQNKHNLLKIGGLMINENPLSGHWPKHGFQWYTTDFYMQLCNLSGYKLKELGTHPAMGNHLTGMNVYCVIEKTKADFITLEEFKTLSLFQK